jgi:hypothetical protein
MLFASLLGFCVSDEPLPKWPSQYHLKGTWNIPAWQLRIPFEVDTDEVAGFQSDRSYTLEHNIHKRGYRAYSIQTTTEENGKTCLFRVTNSTSDSLIEYLPKESAKEKWTYQGETVVLGKQAKAWQMKNDQGVYTFYVEKESGLPLRYHQDGISIRYSHPTIYIFDIEEYSPFANASNFIYPSKGCKNINPDGPTLRERRMLGTAVAKSSELKYLCDEFVPDPIDISGIVNFSWRDVPGVVPLVRDQSNCGSCWAHSATSAISSQLSLMRRGNVTASAQQMVDCVYVTNTTYGCMGGEGPDGFLVFAEEEIDIASEEEYPYIGVSGYCSKSVRKPLGRVKGCKKISVDKNDPTINVLRALYKYGPLMIYIKSTDVFYPYKSGVITDSKGCAGVTEHDQTNHGVLLTGWKRMKNAEGKEVLAYEFMNSWSPLWGDQGFGYIDATYDCGVPVYPLLPVVENK